MNAKEPNNQDFMLQLIDARGVVTVQSVAHIFGSKQAASNALYELRKKGKVKVNDRCEWFKGDV